MELKAMIYNVLDTEDIDHGLISALNDSDQLKALKTKAALVNYVKNSIKSKSKWENVTGNTATITPTSEDGKIVIDVAFKKKFKPFGFNAIVVYEESDAGLKLYNVQIFDIVKISESSCISSVTITISVGD